MQVGGLGYVNTLTAGGKNPPIVNGLDFAGLFSSLTGSGDLTKKGESSKSLQEVSSSQDLKGLLDLLKSTDVFDLKDGKKLLDKALNADSKGLFSAIKDYLGLDDEQLKSIVKNIQSMLSNFSVENAKKAVEKTDKTASESNPEKILNLTSKEVTSGSKELDELLASLNQIMALPIQNMPITNQDFHKMVKVAKLFELLTNNQNGPVNNPQLTEQIKQTIQKLEAVIEQSKGSLRTDYLQKTFGTVATQINSSQKSENGKEKSPLQIKLDSSSGIGQLHQMSKPEQIMVMLDKNGKPVSADQLMQQFESILSKSQFSNTGGTQRLFIKLHPENLGSLRIELTQKDSTIVAKILTSSGAAKDAIESQLQGLKHAFSSQNIQVDRIEVTQQFTDLQERSFQRDHQQGQQQSQEQARQNQSDDGEFNQSFEEALQLNMEV